MHATRTRRSPSNPALRHALALAFGAAPALPALLYCLACYYLPRAARALGWATGPVPPYGAAAARARGLRAGPQAAAALYAPAAPVPCRAVPYANVPVAALAPVLALAYTPAAAPRAARKARKPAPVPMPAAAQRTTGKPGAGPKAVSVYVKVGNRYVCRAPRAGQQAYRRVPHGKAWRYIPI